MNPWITQLLRPPGSLLLVMAVPAVASAQAAMAPTPNGVEMEAPPAGPAPMEGSHGSANAAEPSGHHAMTHPFLSHMGLPDGPGEASVRVTGIQRGLRDSSGTDAAFHVEAGIADRLGLHLRNDAITGAGMRSADGKMEDHGTELMLMYAVLEDAEATRGVSLFGEVAAPTVRGEGPSVKFGGGVGARFILATRLQWDGVVHIAPAEGKGAEMGYETALVVRTVGRVFGVVETRGEISSGAPTNYVLFAPKVGLGETGAARRTPLSVTENYHHA
ncbi:MAG: hypothetical protein SFV15_19615 [Polyangiaceae bacterium]|nr:hypothetical protein [Polyangiaceae bacterium]